MSSGRRHGRRKWIEDRQEVTSQHRPNISLSELPSCSAREGSNNSHSSGSNGPSTRAGEADLSGKLSASPKRNKKAISSLAGGDGDEDMANSGGGVNTNGVTCASPAPSCSSASSPSESGASTTPAVTLLTVKGTSTPLGNCNGQSTQKMARRSEADSSALHSKTGLPLMLNEDEEDAQLDEELIAEVVAAAKATQPDFTSELFYVELDSDTSVMTGVLPEMQQLHVRLMQLASTLNHHVKRLRVLRERARATAEELCERTPSSLPFSVLQLPVGTFDNAHPRTDTATSNWSAIDAETMGGARQPSQRNSNQASQGVAFSLSTHGVGGGTAYLHPSQLDNDSDWCDAATFRSSRSTTTQSTPSLLPSQPPPSLQFLEEDEVADEARAYFSSTHTAVSHRGCIARPRPDSVLSSMQSTPNMLPASSPSCLRSENGDLLLLPSSTASMDRGSLVPPQQQQPATPAKREVTTVLPPTSRGTPTSDVRDVVSTSPAASSPSTAREAPQRDTKTAFMTVGGAPVLTADEKRELSRLSDRVAVLFKRRGLLLQHADRLLCRHAQQHERWEGNEDRRGCYRCRRIFSHLTRRHHCRRCGRLCCAECSRYVGKKQDTSYVTTQHDSMYGTATVAHRTIIKSEYSARITAADTHDLPEEQFDEHTYARRSCSVSGDSPNSHAEQPGSEPYETPLPPGDEERQMEEVTHNATSDAMDGYHSRPRQHKWVRVCAPCYQNCLRARRNNVLQQLKSANLCILDDGYYYYHVMTMDELCRLSTALNKPDSFKKQLELMSHVVVERSADYVAAAPGYSAYTLSAAAQHTPDVLRTLGSIGAYALRSARQTANDYVGGYFASSRTIMPDNHVGEAATAQLMPEHPIEGESGADEETRSEASVVSVADARHEASILPTGEAERSHERLGEKSNEELNEQNRASGDDEHPKVSEA